MLIAKRVTEWGSFYEKPYMTNNVGLAEVEVLVVTGTYETE